MSRVNVVLTPAQQSLRKKLERFICREGLDVPGFSERIILKMVERNVVTKLTDIYRLTTKGFRRIPGVGKQVTGEELYYNLHSCRKTTRAKFIAALGIPALGLRKAEILAENFPRMIDLMDADRRDLERKIILSEAAVDAVLAFFSVKDNYDTAWELIADVGFQWIESDNQIEAA